MIDATSNPPTADDVRALGSRFLAAFGAARLAGLMADGPFRNILGDAEGDQVFQARLRHLVAEARRTASDLLRGLHELQRTDPHKAAAIVGNALRHASDPHGTPTLGTPGLQPVSQP